MAWAFSASSRMNGVDLNYFCKHASCRKWWAHRDFFLSEVIALFLFPLTSVVRKLIE